jgi:hypothetical protein
MCRLCCQAAPGRGRPRITAFPEARPAITETNAPCNVVASSHQGRARAHRFIGEAYDNSMAGAFFTLES